MRLIVVLFFVVALTPLPGCEDLPCNKTVDQARLDAVDKTQLQKDLTAIDAYLAANSITAIQDPSGLRYVVKKQGFGGTPCLENLVTITYVGTLLSNGKEFNASTIQAHPKDLVLGWQIALPLFPAGTKTVLYIPSVYAYGEDGSKIGDVYVVPPNANLIFDIEITNIR